MVRGSICKKFIAIINTQLFNNKVQKYTWQNWHKCLGRQATQPQISQTPCSKIEQTKKVYSCIPLGLNQSYFNTPLSMTHRRKTKQVWSCIPIGLFKRRKDLSLLHEVIFNPDDWSYWSHLVEMATEPMGDATFLGSGKTSHSTLGNDSFSWGPCFEGTKCALTVLVIVLVAWDSIPG